METDGYREKTSITTELPLAYGTAGVLRHSINLVPTGNANGFTTENDWIISPQIDLTNTAGTITLAAYIGRQRSTHTIVARELFIYVSTPQKEVPTLSDFQANDRRCRRK